MDTLSCINSSVELVFYDETGFNLNTKPKKAWIPKGSKVKKTPRLLKSVNYSVIGAMTRN